MTEWISTKERFPNVGELVVIHIPQYDLTLAGEKASRGGWWTEEEGVHFLNDSDIDYWLPIPDLPNENKSGKRRRRRTPEEQKAFREGYIIALKYAQEHTKEDIALHLDAVEVIYKVENCNIKPEDINKRQAKED